MNTSLEAVFNAHPALLLLAGLIAFGVAGCVELRIIRSRDLAWSSAKQTWAIGIIMVIGGYLFSLMKH
jgi:hypothetical protein